MFRNIYASQHDCRRGSSSLFGGLRKGIHTSLKIKIRLVLGLALAVSAFTFERAAQAMPVQLDAAQFTSQTKNLTVTTEDFTSYANTQATPLTFSNGRFNGFKSAVVHDEFYCRSGGWCLVDFAGTWREKSFNALPAGTQFWATDLTIGNGGSDPFDIRVTGGSGILELTNVLLEDVNFVGFFDPLGILSVSFLNKGTRDGNSTSYSVYGIDNVRTASGFTIAVPEPGTLALFGLGLLGLGMARRRKAA